MSHEPLHPLLDLLVAERETEVPFPAFLGEEAMWVTAVLERVAVAHPINDNSDKRVIRLAALRVRKRDISHGHLKQVGAWHSKPREDKATS